MKMGALLVEEFVGKNAHGRLSEEMTFKSE